MNNANLKRQFESWFESTCSQINRSQIGADRIISRAVAWAAYQHCYYRNISVLVNSDTKFDAED